MKIKSFYALPLIVMGFLLSAESVRAEMVITEVAWMGVMANSSCEFIELYNDSDYAIDMTDWTLSVNGSTAKTFTGSDLLVEPGDFRIIERVDAKGKRYCTSTQLTTNNKNLISLPFQLTDSGVSIAVSNVDIFTGLDWTSFAKQNDTTNRKSVQLTAAGQWALAMPTPGAATTVAAQASTSGGYTSSYQSVQTATASGTVNTSGIQGVAIVAPQYVSAGTPVTFTSKTTPVDARAFKDHEWNFGTGDTSTLSAPTYTYDYPGTYVVHLTVSGSNWEFNITKNIIVTEQAFALNRTAEGNYTITNTGSHDADLSLFSLVSAQAFTFPKNTTLVAGGSITVARAKVEPNGIALLPRLVNKNGTAVASYEVMPEALLVPVYVEAQKIYRQSASVAPSPVMVSKDEEIVASTTESFATATVSLHTSDDTVLGDGSLVRNALPYLALGVLVVLGAAGVYMRSRDV